MTPSTYSIVSRHLEEVVVAYWHDVDFNWGQNAASHYTEDAVFVSPTAHYEGRAQIAEFYAWRKERGERVNVHLVSNFFVKALSQARADVHWICTLFASDGVAPQPTALPIVISRVEDEFIRQDDDSWLCGKRSWHTLFKGGIGTTALAPDELAKRMTRT